MSATVELSNRKAVYTDHLIPRGLVGRLEKVLGCRALVVLHDQEGHPLLVTTHRGDQHLTVGLPTIIARYEQQETLAHVERIIGDREGMANLAMWVRDQYFPASYAHATWHRLAPFFQLAGTVVPDASTVHVELGPFNDRTLNRDLARLCERVNLAAPQLPDGRLLSFTIRSSRCILPAQEPRVT